MTKVFKMGAVVLLLTGAVLLADAAYDEWSGTARVEYDRRVEEASREKNGQRFRQLMNWQWIRPWLCIGLGIFVWRVCSHQESLNPLAAGD